MASLLRDADMSTELRDADMSTETEIMVEAPKASYSRKKVLGCAVLLLAVGVAGCYALANFEKPTSSAPAVVRRGKGGGDDDDSDHDDSDHDDSDSGDHSSTGSMPRRRRATGQPGDQCKSDSECAGQPYTTCNKFSNQCVAPYSEGLGYRCNSGFQCQTGFCDESGVNQCCTTTNGSAGSPACSNNQDCCHNCGDCKDGKCGGAGNKKCNGS